MQGRNKLLERKEKARNEKLETLRSFIAPETTMAANSKKQETKHTKSKSSLDRVQGGAMKIATSVSDLMTSTFEKDIYNNRIRKNEDLKT